MNRPECSQDNTAELHRNKKVKGSHPASTESLPRVESPQDSREVASLKVTGKRTGIRSRWGA